MTKRIVKLHAQHSASSTITSEGESPTFQVTKALAYNGGMLPDWGGYVVIDLSGIAPLADGEQWPILLDHATPIGFIDEVAMTEAPMPSLLYSGQLIRGLDEVERIVLMHRGGYRWQQSIHIEADGDDVEHVPEGEMVEVNGRQLKGPVDVLRRSALREISFTGLGRDRHTTAEIAARSMGSEGEDQMTKTKTAATAEEPAPPNASVKFTDDELSKAVEEAVGRAVAAERERAMELIDAAMESLGSARDALAGGSDDESGDEAEEASAEEKAFAAVAKAIKDGTSPAKLTKTFIAIAREVGARGVRDVEASTSGRRIEASRRAAEDATEEDEDTSPEQVGTEMTLDQLVAKFDTLPESKRGGYTVAEAWAGEQYWAQKRKGA